MTTEIAVGIKWTDLTAPVAYRGGPKERVHIQHDHFTLTATGQ